VYLLADVVAAGFEVIPTYRSPHLTIAFYDDPADGIARLFAIPHQDIANPTYRKEAT
jgi:hypothetical protein